MKRIFSLFVSLTLFFTMSCDKEESSDLSFSELKVKVSEQLKVASITSNNFSSNPSMVIFQNVISTDPGWGKGLFSILSKKGGQASSTKAKDSYDTMYKEMLGTYTFDDATGEWKVEKGGDKIIINLPKESEDKLVLTVSDVAFITVLETTVPHKIRAVVTNNGVESSSVDITADVKIEDNVLNFGKLDIELKLDPATYTINSLVDGKVFTMNDKFTMTDNSIEHNIKLNFVSNILTKGENSPPVSGEFNTKFKDIEVKVNFKQLTEPTQNIEDFISGTIYYKGDKAGDLDFSKYSTTAKIYLIYSDGTSEDITEDILGFLSSGFGYKYLLPENQ